MNPAGGADPRDDAPAARGQTPSLRRRARTPARGRGGLWAFLLAGAVPAAGAAWFFLQPQATRDDLLARLPAGWGGRAIHAGIAFGVLVVLARVALPAFHGAAGTLRATALRLAANRGALRVLLYPLEALVGLARVVVQALYGIDVALILAAALVLLLVAVRIMKPEFLPGVLPMLGR